MSCQSLQGASTFSTLYENRIARPVPPSDVTDSRPRYRKTPFSSSHYPSKLDSNSQVVSNTSPLRSFPFHLRVNSGNGLVRLLGGCLSITAVSPSSTYIGSLVDAWTSISTNQSTRSQHCPRTSRVHNHLRRSGPTSLSSVQVCLIAHDTFAQVIIEC